MTFNFNLAFNGEKLSDCKTFLRTFRELPEPVQELMHRHLNDHDLDQALEIITLFSNADADDQKVAFYLLTKHDNSDALEFLQDQSVDRRWLQVVTEGEAQAKLNNWLEELTQLALDKIPDHLQRYFDLEAYKNDLVDCDFAQAYGYNDYAVVGNYVIMWGN